MWLRELHCCKRRMVKGLNRLYIRATCQAQHRDETQLSFSPVWSEGEWTRGFVYSILHSAVYYLCPLIPTQNFHSHSCLPFPHECWCLTLFILFRKCIQDLDLSFECFRRINKWICLFLPSSFPHGFVARVLLMGQVHGDLFHTGQYLAIIFIMQTF